MQFDFYHPGRPVPKGRPRFTKRGGVYTPKDTILAEQELTLAYIAASGPNFDGAISLDVEFSVEGTNVSIIEEEWDSPLRGDLDNYLKTVLDGLEGVAFANDRSVVGIYARKT